MGVDRCYSRYGVAPVKDLVVCQQVFAGEAGATAGRVHLGDGHVRPGDDGLDAGISGSLANVDGLDAGMGMRASQHFAVQQSGCLIVAAVLGATGHFIGAVMPDGPSANNLVIGVGKDNIRGHYNHLTTGIGLSRARDGARRKDCTIPGKGRKRPDVIIWRPAHPSQTSTQALRLSRYNGKDPASNIPN